MKIFDLMQFEISRAGMSDEVKTHFVSAFYRYSSAKKPEDKDTAAFRVKNNWKGADWFHYLNTMRGRAEATVLMNDYYQYHKLQELAFQALQEMDDEAMAAGEPSFLLVPIEKHDWGKMDSILQAIMRWDKRELCRRLLNGTLFRNDDPESFDDSDFDYDRVWQNIKAELDLAKAKG